MDMDQLASLEASWLRRIQPPPGAFGWEPYDLSAFTALLRQAVLHVPRSNTSFIDVGCGIGTKCLVAEQFGLSAWGIDIVPEFLAEAQRHWVRAVLADARTYTRYADFGLVYINHPLVCGDGCAQETELEEYVQAGMASGAVLLSVNYEACPVWPEVARDGDWAAAWVKP